MASPPARPATKGSFAKGKSGNPRGRPKSFADVQALARKHTAANIGTMVELRDSCEDQGIRLRAAVALHEIAWGKPVQQLAGTGPQGEFIVKWLG